MCDKRDRDGWIHTSRPHEENSSLGHRLPLGCLGRDSSGTLQHCERVGLDRGETIQKKVRASSSNPNEWE